MTKQELTLMLTVAIILLIGLSLHVIQLRLKLWALKRSWDHIAVIQARTPPEEPPSNGGASLFIGAMLITVLLGFVLIAR